MSVFRGVEVDDSPYEQVDGELLTAAQAGHLAFLNCVAWLVIGAHLEANMRLFVHILVHLPTKKE